MARYMYSSRTVTVQASRFGAWCLTTNTGNSPPIQKGAPAAMQCYLITTSRRTANANGDTEAAALMFGSLYFILIKYQLFCQVSNAGTDVCVCLCACVCVCVCVCARVRMCARVWCDHFNCFLIPAESTLNTYCLINNHCIKVCFYLWKQNWFYIYNM